LLHVAYTLQYSSIVFVRFSYLFYYVTKCDFVSGSDGILTEKPADATLRPYDALRLNCSSDSAAVPVEWRFTEEGSNRTDTMTSFGGLLPSFRGLFTIDPSNKYDLVAMATNDTKSYCGTYECVDENGDRDAERANARVSSKQHTLLYSVVFASNC